MLYAPVALRLRSRPIGQSVDQRREERIVFMFRDRVAAGHQTIEFRRVGDHDRRSVNVVRKQGLEVKGHVRREELAIYGKFVNERRQLRQ